MNNNKEDLGVMKDYVIDLAFGLDENDFECSVPISRHCCNAGYYLYFEGTEYGGIIDSIRVDESNSEVVYMGRTWHGILNSKVLEPDANQDYLTVTGDANTVLNILISRMNLSSLFKASSNPSGINVNYKMNRYIEGYTGICKMLKAHNAKLSIAFNNGYIQLSAVPLVDYSQGEQFDTDQFDFSIQKYSNHINHVVCLGKGELADREVIHVYADSNGNISTTQILTELEEITAIYDNSNAESSEELRQGGIDIINASWNSDLVDFSFNANDRVFDIGDIIGAKEWITGIEVTAEINKKIVTINNAVTTISYEVGDKTWHI